MSSFVSSLKADQESKDSRKLNTDSSARLIIPAKEIDDAVRLRAAAVGSYFRIHNKPDWTPDPEVGTDGRVVDPRWEVTVTTERVVIWSPLSSAMFGGMKERPGKATGGFMGFDYIDQIDRDGQFGLTFRVDKGEVFTDSMALGLEFPDAQTAKQFSEALATRIPDYWAKEAETAKKMLDTGMFGPDSPNKIYRMLGPDYARQSATDIPRIEAEIAKLHDLDWTDSTAPLSISLARAGAPV